MSWGGTMFEYLMPQLLLRSYPGTLLDQSCRASVRRQIEYGKERGVPWGISESAYAFTDRAGNYQYKAFGVPGLGFKRGLSDDLVVAPYATALASLIDPGAAVSNFVRLTRKGLDGRFGFYESIDYQPRKPESDPADTTGDSRSRKLCAPFLRTIKACRWSRWPTCLHDDIFVTRFHADPRVKATELLLQERVPREAILAEARPAEGTKSAAGRRCRPRRDSFKRRTRTSPHTHFLSNGRYTVALTHAGGGSSTWRGLSVTRRREDRTSDAGSHFIYLTDPWSRNVWSPTYQPVCRDSDEFEAIFELEKVTFRRKDGDFDTQLQVVVSPEDDVEVRRLSITNRGDRPREIEVTSYAEMVLARPEDDLAHPAFGKLFIETEYDPQSAGLLFSRRPRSAEESHAWAFHVLAVDGRLRRRRMGNRSRAIPRPRTIAGESDRARRPRVVRDNRRRARSGRSAARACAAGARRVCARHLRHRCRARSSDGARAGAKISRRQCGGAGVLDGVDARAHHAAASGTDRRSGDALRSAGVARLRIRRLVAPAPTTLRANVFGQSEPVGVRDLRRPADRAGPRRRCERHLARAAAAARAGILARQGSARRRGDHERSPGGLSRRGADAAHQPAARAALGRLAGQAGRDVPAARPTACRMPTAACSRRPRASCSRGDCGDLAPQLDRPGAVADREAEIVPPSSVAAIAGASGHAPRARRA